MSTYRVKSKRPKPMEETDDRDIREALRRIRSAASAATHQGDPHYGKRRSERWDTKHIVQDGSESRSGHLQLTPGDDGLSSLPEKDGS